MQYWAITDPGCVRTQNQDAYVIEALDGGSAITEGALASRAGGATVYTLSRNLAAARTSPELLDALLHLKKAREYALSNVSHAAICGYLQWQLRS